MGVVISFIFGAVVGVLMMCLVSITPKAPHEDDEQEKFTREWRDKHLKK